MRLGLKQEQGFTLIEVVAAIVILSIVSLVLTSYFVHAMSYSKSNQNKTIMVNLARNALFYMEKQDFDSVKNYFVGQAQVAEEAAEVAIKGGDCAQGSCPLLPNEFTGSPANVLNPTINGVAYTIDIVYQPNVWGNQPRPTGAAPSFLDQSSVRSYLLPVKVRVKRADARSPSANIVEVEGYITDERIR